MKAINILGAFLVLACNLIVSFSHTLDLFRAGGFTGGLEFVAAVGVETTFIMGALNIVVSRLRGRSPGGPAILGGVLGVALVSWSNVSAGWEYGPTGILLGLATPASLIVAEAILSRAIIQRRTANHHRADDVVEMAEVVDQPATQVVDSTTESTNQDERTTSHEWSTDRVAESDDRVADQPADRVDERLADQVYEPPTTQADEVVDQVAESTSRINQPKSTTNRPTNVVEIRRKSTTRPASKSTNKSTDQPLEKVVEVAERYYREHGQPPSQRKLAQMAGCSRHKAMKALEALEEIKRQTG